MKLSGLTFITFFLFLGLSAIVFVFFQIYQPYEQAAQYMTDYKGQLDVESAKKSKAEERVRTAMKMVQAAADRWNYYVDRKTPAETLAGGGINLNENPYQLVVDTPKYRDNAQRAFNAQLHAGGVKIVSAPEIPMPSDSEKDILASYYNYPAFSFPVVLWELGTVTVTGTYDQIKKNVNEWSNMPHYLAVVDGLRIDGTSPNLTASYSVTLVGFLKGSQLFPPPSVDLGTASATTGGGPMGGGPRGGPQGGGPTNPGGFQVPQGPPPGMKGGPPGRP